MAQDLEAVRQQYESFLTELEGLAVQALAGGDWDEVLAHISQVRSKTELSDCFESRKDESITQH